MSLTALLLAAAPLDAKYVLVVQDVPVAALEISSDGKTYRYASTHFLEEGPKERVLELPLTPGAPEPEVLALSQRPAPGCRDVLEERTKKKEKLCVDPGGGNEVTGTLDGKRFAATYATTQRLERITIGAATWQATRAPVAAPAESPFVKGVPAPRGPVVALMPPVDATQWVRGPIKGTGVEGRAGRVRCLPLAREAAAKRPGAVVSLGVVLEDGRAFPHAWVTTPEGVEDPSVLPGDPVLAQRRYLEVPKEKAGQFYLGLFSGALRLVGPNR